MEPIQKLKGCFTEALALPSEEGIEKLSYQEHLSWDSVAHMRLVAAIEASFDIMLTTDQILDMSNFEKACEVLRQHGIHTGS